MPRRFVVVGEAVAVVADLVEPFVELDPRERRGASLGVAPLAARDTPAAAG